MRKTILAALAAATLTATPATVMPAHAEKYRTVEAGEHFYVRRGGGEMGCVEFNGQLLIERSGGEIRVRCGHVKPNCFKAPNQPEAAQEDDTIWLGCKEHVAFSRGEGVKKLKAEKLAGAVHVYAGKSGK